jgi:flavin reductase (DIM6/NTAB) family NADH-FMN oxidoreductase RutF
MQKSYFSYNQIMEWEKRYRAAFVNSLGGFKSVCLIGTKNQQDKSNLAIFNSIVHIGANPPLIGFVVRPDSAERHTLENILETSLYTINHLNKNMYINAHQTSARYPSEISEFDAAGLTEEYINEFGAPFVRESHVQIGVEFQQKVNFSINNSSFIIGEIKHVYFPPESLQADGFLDLEKAESITCSGLDSYHTTTKIKRLSYAKPGKWPSEIH